MAGGLQEPRRTGPVGAERDACQHRTVHHGEEIWPLIDQIVHAMESAGFGQRQVFAARLALEEAISNGVKHGNRGDPSKTVLVRFRVAPSRLWAEVEDEGPGFCPSKVPDPLAPENLEREGGRGILLIRKYMTHVSFNERGNCICMELHGSERRG
jgi:serine/threonine-protein kinase RsbW